jgi:hypothetical protein
MPDILDISVCWCSSPTAWSLADPTSPPSCRLLPSVYHRRFSPHRCHSCPMKQLFPFQASTAPPDPAPHQLCTMGGSLCAPPRLLQPAPRKLKLTTVLRACGTANFILNVQRPPMGLPQQHALGSWLSRRRAWQPQPAPLSSRYVP